MSDNTPEFAGTGAAIGIYMADTVAFIAPDATIEEAARTMIELSVSALVIGDASRAIGVVSEHDMVKVVAGAVAPETQVGTLAAPELVSCDDTATVGEVSELMMQEYVRHVVVLDEAGLPVGVVSARDVLGALSI